MTSEPVDEGNSMITGDSVDLKSSKTTDMRSEINKASGVRIGEHRVMRIILAGDLTMLCKLRCFLESF